MSDIVRSGPRNGSTAPSIAASSSTVLPSTSNSLISKWRTGAAGFAAGAEDEEAAAADGEDEPDDAFCDQATVELANTATGLVAPASSTTRRHAAGVPLKHLTINLAPSTRQTPNNFTNATEACARKASHSTQQKSPQPLAFATSARFHSGFATYKATVLMECLLPTNLHQQASRLT